MKLEIKIKLRRLYDALAVNIYHCYLHEGDNFLHENTFLSQELTDV